MKRRLVLFALSFYAVNSYAQIPEDALRMSWNTPSGTARSQAIGGAVGALGGDISSMFVNPAGLAFYKISELVVTPGMSFNTNKGSFRGTDDVSASKNKFFLGTSGAAFVINTPYSKWNSVFSVGINRTADFNAKVHYTGLNTYSSYSQQFLEEAKYNGLDENGVYNYPFTTGLAFYTYLIDTIAGTGGFNGFIGLSNPTTGLIQDKMVTTSGGITELAVAFSAAKSDNFYMGGTIGFPIMNYKRTTVFRESDATDDPNNYFNYSEYTQNYSSKGAGVNLKLGVIFKPVSALRIGVGLHTPTIYGLSEKNSASMITDAETYLSSHKPVYATNDTIDATQTGSFKYNLSSPWKFLVSGAYVFGQDQDVTKQKGFISADLEYVTYGSSRFSSSTSEYGTTSAEDEYYKGVNSATKASYKGAFNARLGGELKFNVLMVRAGFGYYGNPYEDKELKARRMNVSAGAGYRNKGIFVDLTYTHQITKDVDFPYRLADALNTFATINGSRGNALLTFGFKF